MEVREPFSEEVTQKGKWKGGQGVSWVRKGYTGRMVQAKNTAHAKALGQRMKEDPVPQVEAGLGDHEKEFPQQWKDAIGRFKQMGLVSRGVWIKVRSKDIWGLVKGTGMLRGGWVL